MGIQYLNTTFWLYVFACILYVIVYNALHTYVLLVLICLCTTSPEQGLVLCPAQGPFFFCKPNHVNVFFLICNDQAVQ